METFSQRLMVLATMTLLSDPMWAMAQQSFPRPIVLYRPPASTTPRTSTTPISQNVTPTWTNGAPPMVGMGDLQSAGPRTITSGTGPSIGSVPGSNSVALQGQSSGPSPTGQTPSSGSSAQGNSTNTGAQNDAAREWAAQQSLPTNQVLQNPSGLYNMSHTGISTGQQYAPNLYFGPQFQTWTNQRSQTDSPASYGEMSRFQVGPYGGYIAPNTYIGTGFANWNNLSSGSASPSPSGAWTFSIWP